MRSTKLLGLFLLILPGLATGQYLVEISEEKNATDPGQGRRPIVRCEATGASFGEDVMTFGYGLQTVGCALPTEPELACSAVRMPKYNTTLCSTNFAVVPRGNCTFAEKAYYSQMSLPGKYQAIIIYNDPGQQPIPMAGGQGGFADKVQIPAVMVAYTCMESLLHKFPADKGFLVTIKASPSYYDLIKYLVPFVAIVGFCFIVLFISLVIRLCRERRRLARKRLSRTNLRKIPTRKFKKGDAEETCAICLEDFVEADKLRILPCRHAYHCKCVDPWLTKNRKVCPVCKRRVGPSSGSDSSDSDSERATTSTAYNVTVTRDNDLLLRNAQPMATSSRSHGDFLAPSHSSHEQQDDGDNVLMRASSFLNLHSPYNPSSSQQPASSSTQEANENRGQNNSSSANSGSVRQAVKTQMARMRSNFSNLFHRGEQRLRSGGGRNVSGSNTLLIDNAEYGGMEPEADHNEHPLPSSSLRVHDEVTSPTHHHHHQGECVRVDIERCESPLASAEHPCHSSHVAENE